MQMTKTDLFLARVNQYIYSPLLRLADYGLHRPCPFGVVASEPDQQQALLAGTAHLATHDPLLNTDQNLNFALPLVCMCPFTNLE